MQSIIVDGNKIADSIINDLKKKHKEFNRSLNLAVVLVGKDAASVLFVKKKQEVARKLDIGFRVFEFENKISNRTLRKALSEIANDKKNNGILVQLPLPSHLNTQYILDTIPLKKDVDVLSSISLGKFYNNKGLIFPPVVGAILKVFAQYDINVEAKSVVIVGAGQLVGKPLAIELLRRGATISVLNSLTPRISDYSLGAEILISGVGKPGIITQEMIKKGACIIDAGISSETAMSGKKIFKGDIDFTGIDKKAKLIVPSSGGLGPITVAMVMNNLVELARKYGI